MAIDDRSSTRIRILQITPQQANQQGKVLSQKMTLSRSMKASLSHRRELQAE